MRAFFGRQIKSLNQNALALLVLTALMWAANGVVSRAAVGAIAPMLLVSLRWLVVCALLFPLARRDLAAYWPTLRARKIYLCAMAFAGYTGFNILFYLAGYWTSAVNITLLQGSIPPMVLAGAALFGGELVSTRQIFGMIVSFIGVLLIASHGDLGHLSSFAFNPGDAMLLVACALYAGYTIALRRRPPVPPLVFFAGMAIAAFVESLPFLGAEIALGHGFWPTPKGFALVIFVAIAPSLLSQLFFMRAVELIGAGRAGVFTNLTPLFGPILAVALLGEPFHFYHAAALSLGLAGIFLAESGKRRV